MSSIEDQVYSYLRNNLGYNSAGASGIMANIEKESNFNPNATGDGGTSYGLCQWHAGRFTKLKNYCNKNHLSWKSAAGQLSYLDYEIKQNYPNLHSRIKSVPDTEEGAYQAAYAWCIGYEIPANKETVGNSRGNLAASRYYPRYGGSSAKPIQGNNFSTGSNIVKYARDQIGKLSTADGASLVHSCYNQAGLNLEDSSANGYYQAYKDKAMLVTNGSYAPGDLIFFKDNPNSNGFDRVAIATGDGKMISASGRGNQVIEGEIGTPSAVLRILPQGSTAPVAMPNPDTGDIGSSGAEGMSPNAYASLTSIDPYAEQALLSAQEVAAEGYDYGYLIDLTNGGSFKFYIPEFTETAGANWSDISIRGRSVTVKSYESTNSRSVSISLDLYAGAGIYSAQSGEDGMSTIDRMHKDAYFVKSLEYPDYTTAITQPPPTVNLILGSAINFIGVVSGVSVEHMKPLDRENRSMYIKLSFTVTQIATNPIDYRDVRSEQYTMINTSNVGSLGTKGETRTNAPIYSNPGGPSR